MISILLKIRNLIKKGLVTLDRTDQKGQASFLETVSSYESIKPLGFESIPKQSTNPLVLLLNVNGNESSKVGFEFDNKKRFKTETLDPGDVCVFNPYTQSVYNLLKNDGLNKVIGDKIVVGNSTVELLQQISDHLQQTSDLADADSKHLHASITGSTGIPDNAATMIAIKAAILAIKLKVDSIKGTV